MRTKLLIRLHAIRAIHAGRVEPFYADGVTDVDRGGQLSFGDDDAGAFVATYYRGLAREGPVVLEGVEVGVADA